MNAFSLLAEVLCGSFQRQRTWRRGPPSVRETARVPASRPAVGRAKATPGCAAPYAKPPWAASRTNNSYFRALYHRKARTRDKNRALIAVAHSLLTTVYSLTTAGQPYRDLGLDYFDRLNRQNLQRSLVKRLESWAITLLWNLPGPLPDGYFQGSGYGNEWPNLRAARCLLTWGAPS